MPGPSYQDFKGYADPVKNYFAGQDAGRARAVEDFNTKQTLETQNALVQQSGARSYPQLQAQQMQAKQLYDQYNPTISKAMDTNNTAMLRSIGETYEKSGNPILRPMAQTLKTINTIDGKEFTFTTVVDSPESAQRLVERHPSILKLYGSADMIPRNTPLDFTTLGPPTEPGSIITKAVHSKGITQAKPQTQTMEVKTQDEIDALREANPNNPEAQQVLDQAELALPGSPGGLSISFPGTAKTGVKSIKVPYQKPQQDTVSTLEGLMAAVADAPPAIATKILAEAVPAIKKGNIITLARDAKGVLTGSIISEKRPPSAGGGIGSAWQLTPEETAALTKAIDEKRLNPNKVNSRTAKVYAGMELEKPGMSFAGKAADIEADSKSLGNQQKIRDMMASFVSNMSAQIDRMGEITKDLSRTDTRLLNIPIRQLGMRVKGSAIESKVSMYLTEISNEIGKLSTGSAASVAELSLGAQKKWDKIHDPNLSLRDLMSLLRETQHAGNLRMQSVDNTIGKTKGRLKGELKLDNAPSLDSYIKTMVAKYPQYKTKTRAEWQAAYDKKFSGGQ